MRRDLCYDVSGSEGESSPFFRAQKGIDSLHGKENMYSKINAMALFGMEGVLIRVECDASSGLPEMSMVGFLGAEVREAKDRVRTASAPR